MKLILFLTLLYLKNAQAEIVTPLARSAEVSEIEYRAYLLSEPQYFAVSRALVNDRPAIENTRELRARYDEAERAYISADLSKAFTSFVAVTALALQDDWNDGQRAIIFYAYLRSAQMSPNLESRQNYLHLAARFDSKAKIDENLFPPPLVEDFKIIKSEEVIVPVTLSRAFAAYTYALLNGTLVELKKYALRVPAGEFRLTLISDSLKPVTRILTASQLKSWQPTSEYMARGSCAKPEFFAELPSKAAGLYNDECLSTKTLDMAVRTPTLIEQTLQNREPYLRETNKKVFYGSKWFWGFIGVATAAIVIDHNRNRDGGGASEPTVKDGF